MKDNRIKLLHDLGLTNISCIGPKKALIIKTVKLNIKIKNFGSLKIPLRE